MVAGFPAPEERMSTVIEQLEKGVTTCNACEMEALASAFANEVPENTILALYGDLGTGKTTFVRGLARAWAIKEPITSPTFNLYTVYQGNRQLIHLDAYRLEPNQSLDTLMIEDFINTPWCFAIEWPERVADSLPKNAWRLNLDIDSDQHHTISLTHSAE